MLAFLSKNRFAPVRFLIGGVLLLFTAGFFFLAPEKQTAALEFQGYTNLVTRTRTGSFVTNQYAAFFLENRGDYALTYGGTPLPSYNIEHLAAKGWQTFGDPIRIEELATLLPGERIDFKVWIPETTNKWRVAVNFLRRSKIPYPLKRFFTPTLYSLASSEALPWQEIGIQLASTTNSIQLFGENLTK